VLLIWCGGASVAVVDSTEHALVLRFGRIVRVIDAPGLALILPFDRVQRLDRRLLFFSPAPAEYLTLDKKNVVLQPLLAWRIAMPERFFSTVADRPSAEARLADVAQAEIGSVLGRYPFAALVSDNAKEEGRQSPNAEIDAAVAGFARAVYGIEVAEIELRQLSLPNQNRQSVFERMRAERGRLAKRYRSEGELAAKRIIAEADRERW
jgi:modulator of FtsH protease HflC